MHEFYIRPGSRLSTKNTADWNARYYEKGLAILFTKSQLISKAIYGLLNSPQKQTDEFVLFAFLLFTANKSNSSVHFLGESTARQPAFWFYLTFTDWEKKTTGDSWVIPTTMLGRVTTTRIAV